MGVIPELQKLKGKEQEKVEQEEIAIIQAAENGDLKAIQKFLKEGGNIELEDFHKGPLLKIAVNSNQNAAAKFLFEKGADPYKMVGCLIPFFNLSLC